MSRTEIVAAAKAGRRRSSRLPWFLALSALCALVFVGSAYAATTYYYFTQSEPVSPGQGGADNTVNYRNFDDSCSYYGYAKTKSYYTLSSGTWVASNTVKNDCYGTPEKAHLGPSSDYGYTYVQAKCLNADTVPITLLCWTTRPS